MEWTKRVKKATPVRIVYKGEPTGGGQLRAAWQTKIEKFKGEIGQLKMIEWYKENLAKDRPGKRGPQNKKPIIEDGKKFYKASIRNNKSVILTTELVLNERKWGFNEKTTLRSYPCYTDKDNPDTLEWWLIYYE